MPVLSVFVASLGNSCGDDVKEQINKEVINIKFD